MTVRPPHFECGASTNSATRPYIQSLLLYTNSSDFVTSLKINSQGFAGIIPLRIL